MAQNKSSKRKRNAKAQHAQKIAKVEAALPSPPTDDFEPKSLHTVISEEELDIATDTLVTLAKYPSLTKSKLCKDLRVAVYEFRQSCTTGVNSAEGANLTGRVTAALSDEKYLEARILLAEMRLRNEEPKLGALCRWVRDLDVVSQPNGVSLDSPERSTKDKELLTVLDAVMRVSCAVDMKASLPSDSATHISFQPSWDLRSASVHDQVYASVLDKSIFTQNQAAVTASLRILETVPGHLRKPPNRHAAILYTTKPDTIPLSPEHPSITHHKHPNVPNLSLIKDVLTPGECKAIIAAGEGLWARVSPFIPSVIDGKKSRGLNRRFRVYRYVPGAEYRSHIDGAWPPSGISADDKYIYDDSPPGQKQSSLFTFLLYLNDEFEGGETMFFLPSPREGTLNAYPVRPVMGGVALFPHGETKGALLHEGTSVTKGAKYIIRTDVEYDVERSE
ncbi:hypothetical protein LLEC1_06923 [Akanthomyces lecanii]|uniref:Fe2OG dioxygenase domain-containing protein n=1 Tax=Cordyceps confragosa TaxID=2714763 RepID=A0A179IL32_CORDF|nr:hypothetical protein LLEC1_06923 [Akanthomyces lecanii]